MNEIHNLSITLIINQVYTKKMYMFIYEKNDIISAGKIINLIY